MKNYHGKLIFIPNNVPSLKNSKVKTGRGIFSSPTVNKYLRALGIQSFSSSKKFVKGYVIKELVEIITEGDEASLVDENRDKIIVIDVHTIGTTDFDLNEVQKEFLELAGRVATLRFIEKYYPDIALDKTNIAHLSSRVEELKTKI